VQTDPNPEIKEVEKMENERPDKHPEDDHAGRVLKEVVKNLLHTGLSKGTGGDSPVWKRLKRI
jgi:hypothetical protein